MKKIVMATNNKGKIKELKEMLKDYDVLTQKETFEDVVDVEENGLTFEENAIIKAESIKNKVLGKMCILAEDSGICIDALDGYPGTKTKRAAMEDISQDITDYDRNEYYIQNLGNNTNRKVVWQTAVAFIDLDGNLKTFIGEVEGEVAKTQVGENGFGFDPIFYISSENKTLAQMSDEEKSNFSARKRAIEKLMKYLEEKTK